MLDKIVHDVRYAFRALYRDPSLSAAVILSLALGIGAVTAAFGLVDAVLLRPLDAKNPHELFQLYTRNANFGPSHLGWSSYPDYLDYRDQSDAHSGLAAYAWGVVSTRIGNLAEPTNAEIVTPNYFEVLGLQPSQGRLDLSRFKGTELGGQVAVVSYAFWTSHHGDGASIEEKRITVNGHSFDIVGVAPKSFHGTSLQWSADIWVPVSAQRIVLPTMSGADPLTRRQLPWFGVFGRLKVGLSLAQAQEQIGVIGKRLEEHYRQLHPSGVPILISANSAQLPAVLRQRLSSSLIIVSIIVASLLVISCVNAASLLFVRAKVRQREFAIRQAAGSTRARLAQLMMTESVVLALLAGAIGIIFASLFVTAFSSLESPFQFTLSVRPRLDTRILLFGCATSLLTALLFGALPSIKCSRTDLARTMQTRDTTSRQDAHSVQTFEILIIMQVVVSATLLVVAVLCVQSVFVVRSMDAQHTRLDLLYAEIQPLAGTYSGNRLQQLYRDLLERASAISGVGSVALSNSTPLSMAQAAEQVTINGIAATSNAALPILFCSIISPRFFSTMGIALRSGRDFTDRDGAKTPKVIIVNESMARRFWGEEDPLGRDVYFTGDPTPRIVVGVVADTIYRFLWETAEPHFYQSLSQVSTPEITLVVGASANRRSLTERLRKEIAALDKELPILKLVTASEQLKRSMAQPTALAWISTFFALIASLLSLIGIFGNASYLLSNRRSELALRMALGASMGRVVQMLVRRGIVVVSIGVAIAILTSIFFQRIALAELHSSPTSQRLAIVCTLVCVFVVAVLTYATVAWRASRCPIAESLNHG